MRGQMIGQMSGSRSPSRSHRCHESRNCDTRRHAGTGVSVGVGACPRPGLSPGAGPGRRRRREGKPAGLRPGPRPISAPPTCSGASSTATAGGAVDSVAVAVWVLRLRLEQRRRGRAARFEVARRGGRRGVLCDRAGRPDHPAGFDVYLYRLSDAEAADDEPSHTAEASVTVSYTRGAVAVSTRQVLDAASYRGAYFGELSLGYTRASAPTSDRDDREDRLGVRPLQS